MRHIRKVNYMNIHRYVKSMKAKLISKLSSKQVSTENSSGGRHGHLKLNEKATIVFVLLSFVMTGSLVAQQLPQSNSPDLVDSSRFVSAEPFTYKIINSTNGTWGYDIYVGKKLTIHQLCIPGIAGVIGFKTQEGASKVAVLVIEKMKKGEKLPAITQDELRKLNAN